MGATMKDLGIDRWAPEDRERLAREILASLDAPPRRLTAAEWAQHDAELDSFSEVDLEDWDDVCSTSEASA